LLPTETEKKHFVTKNPQSLLEGSLQFENNSRRLFVIKAKLQEIKAFLVIH
jgi:hypothetical protein